jgi:hypothetical protein
LSRLVACSAPSITHPSRGNAGSVAWSQHFLAVHPRTKQTRRLFNVKKLNCPSLKFFNFKLCFQLFNYSSPTRGHTTHTGGQAHTTRDYAQGDTRPTHDARDAHIHRIHMHIHAYICTTCTRISNFHATRGRQTFDKRYTASKWHATCIPHTHIRDPIWHDSCIPRTSRALRNHARQRGTTRSSARRPPRQPHSSAGLDTP